jgi:hypothetical protein
MLIIKIKSQIKSPYFHVILKISKSSQNDLKSDFVKSSIKSLNTLAGSSCASTIFVVSATKLSQHTHTRPVDDKHKYMCLGKDLVWVTRLLKKQTFGRKIFLASYDPG